MIHYDLQNHRPLRELVYEALKSKILTGDISPGTRMMEIELAEEMGVSRTPVREAIRKLEKEGLVTIEPRKGAYASSISVIDMVDTLEVRGNLEGFAAALAAERITDSQLEELNVLKKAYAEAIEANDTERIIRIDEDFHRKIIECSGNSTLQQVSKTVQELALRFRYLYYDNFTRYKNMPKEHSDIIEAIASGDAQRAKEISEKHTSNLKDFIITEGDAFLKKEH